MFKKVNRANMPVILRDLQRFNGAQVTIITMLHDAVGPVKFEQVHSVAFDEDDMKIIFRHKDGYVIYAQHVSPGSQGYAPDMTLTESENTLCVHFLNSRHEQGLNQNVILTGVVLSQ